jgi:hypothetical protein
VIMMHQNAIGMIICQSYWVAIALYWKQELWYKHMS